MKMNISQSTLRNIPKTFAFKAGLTGGAAYYLAQQGVWRNSDESNKLYGKMYEASKPYLQMLPFEIPSLPSTNRTSYLIKGYWNKGVGATFEYLGDLPHHINGWIGTGVEKARENPGIRKFFDSFSPSLGEVATIKAEVGKESGTK